MSNNANNSISTGATPYISSLSGVSNSGSAMDIMSYVELLLVQDYDNQLKDMAKNIKSGNRLKEAYREHKNKLNDLLQKPVDGGKVKLNAEEMALYKSQPAYVWDSSMNDGMGGIKNNDPSAQPPPKTLTYTPIKQSNNGPRIAPNETATWWGDPHFDDADSKGATFNKTDWDFQGVAGQNYIYLQDNNLKMTAQHEAFNGGKETVVGEINLILAGPSKESHIAFNADKTPVIDGANMVVGKTYNLADGGTAMFNGNTLNVKTAEGYQINLVDQGGYLNGSVSTGAKGVTSDGRAPAGLIGSQFDADSKISKVNGDKFITTPPPAMPIPIEGGEVELDKIKSAIETMQSKIDSLNSGSELAQTDIATITSQRKLSFETLSSIISKVSEGSSTVVRNIK